MQSSPVDANGKALYSSMGDCFVKSVKSEGVLVLWRGFTPAFVKLGEIFASCEECGSQHVFNLTFFLLFVNHLAPYTIISLTLADKLTKAVTGKDAL